MQYIGSYLVAFSMFSRIWVGKVGSVRIRHWLAQPFDYEI